MFSVWMGRGRKRSGPGARRLTAGRVSITALHPVCPQANTRG